MAQQTLLDTDILIDVSRSVMEAIVYVRQLEHSASIAISIVTEMELIVGCRNKEELRILDRFLRRFDVIPINETIPDFDTKIWVLFLSC